MKRLTLMILVVLLLLSLAACERPDPGAPGYAGYADHTYENDAVPGRDDSVEQNGFENDPDSGWSYSGDDDLPSDPDRQPDIPSDLSEGDVVTFGVYHGEPIRWIVLIQGKGRALLLSRDVITDRPYDGEMASDGTWENCEIRRWLNNEFFYEAFSYDEQSLIPEVWLQAEYNPQTGADSGNDTYDRVFLLSLSEVTDYLPSESARRCEESSGSWYWCLRTAGGYSEEIGGEGRSQAAPVCIYYDGTINYWGQFASDTYGIRPAIWIEPW